MGGGEDLIQTPPENAPFTPTDRGQFEIQPPLLEKLQTAQQPVEQIGNKVLPTAEETLVNRDDTADVFAPRVTGKPLEVQGRGATVAGNVLS